MYGNCLGGGLAGVLMVFSGCLKGVWMVFGGYLWMHVWYVRCLDVSEGQVWISQVRIGEARTGQDRCLAGISRVSGGYLWDVRMVCEVSRCIRRVSQD